MRKDTTELDEILLDKIMLIDTVNNILGEVEGVPDRNAFVLLGTPAELIQAIKDLITEAKQWLKPSEIANMSLIVNSKGRGDYRYVLRLIKNGKLKARDWSQAGEKPYWLVHVEDIDKYNHGLRGEDEEHSK